MNSIQLFVLPKVRTRPELRKFWHSHTASSSIFKVQNLVNLNNKRGNAKILTKDIATKPASMFFKRQVLDRVRLVNHLIQRNSQQQLYQ